MSKNKPKGPIIDPGMCRCCGKMKKCRLLNVEYEFMGQPEVYSEMFGECFGIMLSRLDGKPAERLICASCVVRLRDARAFRAQVLRCEQKLINNKKGVAESSESSDECDVLNTEPEVKDKVIISSDDEPMDTRDDSRNTNNSTQGLSSANETPPVNAVRRAPSSFKQLNVLQNVITIVENSFVCPFTSRYSDYHCAYCGDMFTDPVKLREHNLTHDAKTYENVVNPKTLIQIDIARIDCRLCPAQIDNIDSFKAHITKVHRLPVIPTDVSCEFLAFKLEITTLPCLECGKIFDFFHSLKKHMAEHFGTFICDECGARYFDERHINIHRQSHERPKKPPKVPCEQCGKLFHTNYRKNIHVSRVHNNEPAFKCNICNEMFVSCEVRLQHKIDVHGEKRELPCEVCFKIFNCHKTLNIHRKSHSLQYPYECKFCDKKFKVASGLKNHMPTHTGEMNYTCDYCGKKYSRARALRVHIKSHHMDKKFSCSLCPQSYIQAMGLVNHMKAKHPGPEESSLYNYYAS